MNAVATFTAMPLDDATAKRLRRAAQQLDKWLTDRNELIRQAHEAGASYREIAAECGLSHVGVMKIVKKPHQGGEHGLASSDAARQAW